jgi:hypothetical protein
MPSPYARNRRVLQAAILARVEAGARLRAVCAGAGMPCVHTVRNWALADGRFAQALALARRIGDARRKPGRRRAFDQALADRIIVGVNKGLKLEAVLAADPALPCRPTLRRWRREEPEFDLVLRKMFAAWRSLGQGLAGASPRGSAGERRVPELARAVVCEAIRDGGSFASLARDGLASRGTLRRWYRADPDFAEAVDDACDFREETLDFELWMAAEGVPPGPVREMNRAVAPITREILRMRHRPGAVHRAREGR